MAAGFIDKVRIIHILHDELRDFRTLDIKNCTKLKFSNGGHYLVIVDQKQLWLYSSYTLELVDKQKCPSQNISKIEFNEKDTCLVIVSNDGFLYRWDLVNFTKKGEGSIDRNCDFKSCMFLNNDPKDEFKVIAVGSENQRGLFRIYNQKEDVELNIQC